MITRTLFLAAVALLVAAEARPDLKKRLEDMKEKRAMTNLKAKRQAKTSLGIRLVGGETATEGRIEVYRYLHGWGTVCDDWFEDVDAGVACSMLGFSGGEAVGAAFFGEGEGDIFLDNVECTGEEHDLFHCARNDWGDHNCGHNEDAGVRCQAETAESPSSETAQVRLVNGTGPHEGRVEVLYNGVWGTVCDDWWETPDAEVVCRQLGMTGGQAIGFSEFGEGTGPILLDSVECNGDESSIDQCSHAGWETHDCSHYEDASVICDQGSGGYGGGATNIRLANGDEYSGRVEIEHNGEWGTICDDGWDDVDATVLCQSLGFTSGIALEDNDFGSGEGTIWLEDVECLGFESSIEDCDHSEWGVHDCRHWEDAGVICS